MSFSIKSQPQPSPGPVSAIEMSTGYESGGHGHLMNQIRHTIKHTCKLMTLLYRTLTSRQTRQQQIKSVFTHFARLVGQDDRARERKAVFGEEESHHRHLFEHRGAVERPQSSASAQFHKSFRIWHSRLSALRRSGQSGRWIRRRDGVE